MTTLIAAVIMSAVTWTMTFNLDYVILTFVLVIALGIWKNQVEERQMAEAELRQRLQDK